MRDTEKRPYESEVENYFRECFEEYIVDGKRIEEIQPAPTGVGGDLLIKLEGENEWLLGEVELKTDDFITHGHDPKAVDVLIVLRPNVDLEYKERGRNLPKSIVHIKEDSFWRWRKYIYLPTVSERVKIKEYEAQIKKYEAEIKKYEVEIKDLELTANLFMKMAELIFSKDFPEWLLKIKKKKELRI